MNINILYQIAEAFYMQKTPSKRFQNFYSETDRLYLNNTLDQLSSQYPPIFKAG